MNAGDLRHRVTIQTPTVTRDASGAEVISWTDAATVWALVKPLSLVRSGEFWAAQAQQAKLTHEVHMRYRAGITPRQRISWRSRVFDIKSVVNVDERNVELILLCEELA